MDSVVNCRLIFTLDEFEKYCNDVADTAAWGGQLEVRIPAIYSNKRHSILIFNINFDIFSMTVKSPFTGPPATDRSHSGRIPLYYYW